MHGRKSPNLILQYSSGGSRRRRTIFTVPSMTLFVQPETLPRCHRDLLCQREAHCSP